MFTGTAFFQQQETGLVPANLLLDLYPNAYGAYSLRKLRSSYTGAAIRVRRTSDDTEQDIGFSATYSLDRTALTNFTGTYSATVVTWYDQSGNNYHARQSATVYQPRIVNAGTIDTSKSNPAIYFGTQTNNWWLGITQSFLYLQTSLSYYQIAQIVDHTSSNAGVFGSVWWNAGGATAVPRGLEVLQVDLVARPTYLRLQGTVRNDNAAAAYRLWNNNAMSITEIYGSSSAVSAFRNNTSVTLTNSSAMPTLSFLGTYSIGNYFRTEIDPKPMNGYWTELIIYNTNQVPNRSNILSNINTYYVAY